MTKQIAIKEHKSKEQKEEDIHELAQHFPAFLWYENITHKAHTKHTTTSTTGNAGSLVCHM